MSSSWVMTPKSPGRGLVLSVVVFCCRVDVFFSGGNELSAFGCCCSGVSCARLPPTPKGVMVGVLSALCE